MECFFQFGHTVIEAELPDDLEIPADTQKFCCEKKEADAFYRMEYSDRLLEEISIACAGAQDVIARGNVKIYLLPFGECRVLSIDERLMPYGMYQEMGNQNYRIVVDKAQKELLHMDIIFMSLFALEKQILKRNSVILHCAYIRVEDEAILFSAPSGTGKSTQAALWEKYRGARTINGDRALLIRENNGWYVHGWPISGTSGICENETLPIRTIVMLRQAQINEVKELKGIKAIQKLMGQITINMWNSDFQMQALELIEKLISEVAVWEFGCDISEQSVEYLNKFAENYK